MTTDEPAAEPGIGRIISTGNEPVYLDLSANAKDQIGDHLADLWHQERGSEWWRRCFIMHCSRGGRPLYPLALLDDGTVLPNSYDSDEALRVHAQVVGFADRTYAQIVGHEYPSEPIGGGAVLSWEGAVENPSAAMGRCPIYRSRDGAAFIDQAVIDKFAELDP